jgi:hypothetical protein
MQGGYCGGAAERPKVSIPLEEILYIEGIGDVVLKDLKQTQNGIKLYNMTYKNTEGKSCQCKARLYDYGFRYDDWALITAQPKARFEQQSKFGSQYLVTLS